MWVDVLYSTYQLDLLGRLITMYLLIIYCVNYRERFYKYSPSCNDTYCSRGVFFTHTGLPIYIYIYFLYYIYIVVLGSSQQTIVSLPLFTRINFCKFKSWLRSLFLTNSVYFAVYEGTESHHRHVTARHGSRGLQHNLLQTSTTAAAAQ